MPAGLNVSNLIIPVALIAVFYFLFIRPQQQAQKRQVEMVASLKPGTEIVTIGGIFGTVVAIDKDRVRLRVADGSELELAVRAVNSVVPKPETSEPDEAHANEPPVSLSTGGESDDEGEDDAQ